MPASPRKVCKGGGSVVRRAAGIGIAILMDIVVLLLIFAPLRSQHLHLRHDAGCNVQDAHDIYAAAAALSPQFSGLRLQGAVRDAAAWIVPKIAKAATEAGKDACRQCP